ncbi:ATP-dependent endonuclease [Streptomyces sp. NPDC059740]|uniref:ATP-dependent nuclease n=1 Tax=Streptomyces sp. NPDC059740 TaxID=3346926 RepID=UPI00364B7E66
MLDTIVRLEAERAGPLWEKALTDVVSVVVADESSGFSKIREEMTERIRRFVGLTAHQEPVDIHLSEATREHLRETLRLFVATQPGRHAVPFNRLSTGTLNLLVFALLTYIAELKGESSVIFAMEEPGIALPPHAQRRLVDFVTRRMGQAIVTSHSPYVIDKFDPAQIVVLGRDEDGTLSSSPVVLPQGFKAKRFSTNRRQFAEAVLARAVLVVEGSTEADLVPVIADVLEQDPSVVDYVHPDLAGVSVFNAGGDHAVPAFAPLFKSLDKRVYGIHDTPTKPLSEDVVAKADDFALYRVIDYKRVEDLLVAEVPAEVQRRFLSVAGERSDYPVQCGWLRQDMDDAEVAQLVRSVLMKHKGSGYAALLVSQCTNRRELPASIVEFLLEVNADLYPPTGVVQDSPATGDGEVSGEPE